MDSQGLLDRAASGDTEALGQLFAEHRERLKRMVQMRLHPRLRSRLDASDVIQEVYVEYARSLSEYVKNPEAPFFLWLRFLTGRKIQGLHRHHLGVHMRDAGREIAIDRGAMPQASSVYLAAQLLGKLTSPSAAAIRSERRRQLEIALNAMDPIDREVLALRHFEQLSNSETAEVLGISQAAASNRFVRALARLKKVLLEEKLDE
jgi:RNA polymerase sigma-70 factor (ECF subfamily)